MEKILRLPAKQFARLMWYEEVEPFGELRADWRSAQIVAMIHNVAVKPEYQKTVDDFLLTFSGSRPKKEKKKQSVREQIEIMTILAHALAGAPRE